MWRLEVAEREWLVVVRRLMEVAELAAARLGLMEVEPLRWSPAETSAPVNLPELTFEQERNFQPKKISDKCSYTLVFHRSFFLSLLFFSLYISSFLERERDCFRSYQREIIK